MPIQASPSTSKPLSRAVNVSGRSGSRRLGTLLDGEPSLKIDPVTTNSTAGVVAAGLDIVLHVGPLADSNLVARQIGWTRSLVCASSGYLAAAREPRHPKDLARYHAVVYARRDEESNASWTFIRE